MKSSANFIPYDYLNLRLEEGALHDSSSTLFALFYFFDDIKSELPGLNKIIIKISTLIEDNSKTNEQKEIEIKKYFLEKHDWIRRQTNWATSQLREKIEEALDASWLLGKINHEAQPLNAIHDSEDDKRYGPSINKSKPIVTSIEAFSDSLSERETLAKRKLFGFIPMDGLSGLKGRTPHGRFTNGYVWLDALGASILEEFVIRQLMQDAYVFHNVDTLEEVKNCKSNSYRKAYVIVNNFKNGKSIYYIHKNREKNPEFVKDLKKNETQSILNIMERKRSHYLTNNEKQKIETLLGKKLKARPGMSNDEINAAINTQDNILTQACHAAFTMDNDLAFTYNGREFMTTYCEGGLTSADWSKEFTFNPKLFFTRQIVSTLAEKRKLAFQHDLQQGTSQEDMEQRLSIVWSSANDLVTVNSHPTYEAAHIAVQAMKQHLNELMKHGRKKIVVGNMPNLALTPRYQLLGKDDDAITTNAYNVTVYYNKLLSEMTAELQNNNGCKIEIFDINKEFQSIYDGVKNDENNDKEQNPLKLKIDKLNKPYTDSPDYKRPDENGGTSPSEGYMFDDDLHPTADVHALLAKKFQSFLNERFDLQPPEKHPVPVDIMVKIFKNRYIAEMDSHEKQGFFSLPKIFGLRNVIKDIPEDERGLQNILAYALSNGGRSHRILRDLCWIDSNGKLNPNYPSLSQIPKSASYKRTI